MKAGDKTPVNIGAHTVAQAEVKEVNIEDGTVTLVVPATLVVMGIRTDFTDLPNTTAGSDTETIITGVTGPDGPITPEAPPVVTPDVAPVTAPVVEPVTPVEPVQPVTPVVPEEPGTNVETPPIAEAPSE